MKKLFCLTLIAFVLTSILVSCPQGSEKKGTTGGNGITTTGGTNGSTQGGSSSGSGSGNTGGSSGGESGNGSEPSTPKTYIVTFEANGGTGTMEPQVFTENESQALKKNEFSWDGFGFIGWSSTKNYYYNDQESITITEDTTLYAMWGHSCTITFNANGGEGTMEPQVFIEYVPGSLPVLNKNKFTREGFYFKCWEDENGNRYQDQEFIKIKDITLYAVWTCLGALPDYVGTAGADWEYVTFGEWPQSVLPQDSTVTISRYDTKKVGMFTYYLGSDGAWYVEQLENAHDNTEAYKYSDGTQVPKGSSTTRYFKVEPIKWRVLDTKDGKKFLLAENALTALRYYDVSDGYRRVDSKTVYPNNYMHSKVRAWLNGYNYLKETEDCMDHQDNGFLQTAFATVVQNKIIITNVDNTSESTGYDNKLNPWACDNTNDKVFLLSGKEARNKTYGFHSSYTESDSKRIRKPTDFALATGAYKFNNSFGSTWWLRSPTLSVNYMVRFIKSGGAFYEENPVARAYYTIVPALWVEYED